MNFNLWLNLTNITYARGLTNKKKAELAYNAVILHSYSTHKWWSPQIRYSGNNRIMQKEKLVHALFSPQNFSVTIIK